MTTTTASSARPSLTSRIMAQWPFFIGPLMLAIAEIVQFAQHGSDGWERAMLRNALVFLVGVPGIVGASGAGEELQTRQRRRRLLARHPDPRRAVRAAVHVQVARLSVTPMRSASGDQLPR